MNNRIKILFLAILFLAAFLRFYRLGKNPPSLDWDEASLGYNAYHLLKTGTDEYGVSWPLAIRSFGDYKPPMYVYLTIPWVALFGLNEMAVRFPSAFFGTLAVFIVYFLAKEMFGRKDVAILSMFFLAVSPWHLQFSRVAFEANIGLFWFTAGTWLFLKAIHQDDRFLILSAGSYCLSLYSYHSSRLVLPFFLLGLAWYYRQFLLAKKKKVLISFLVGLLLILPLLITFRSSGIQARFSSVSIFSSSGLLDRSIKQTEQDKLKNLFYGKLIHNRRIIYALVVMKGYLDHWRFDFLFLSGDGPWRHHAGGVGMLYLWDFPFLLLGIYWLIEKKKTFPLFWWFLCAPLASAISTGTPHAVRSLLYLPTFQIFTAVGALESKKIVLKKGFWGRSFLGLICLALFFNIFYYFHQYYVHTPIDYAPDWQFGYKEMVKIVSEQENNYNKVIVTSFYDQPYIFFLFYRQMDPSSYVNSGSDYLGFGKYEFRRLNWEQDRNLKNTLLVGAAEEIPNGSVTLIKEIYFPDGKVAFRIIGT